MASGGKTDLKPSISLSVKTVDGKKPLVIESLGFLHMEQLLMNAQKCGHMITKDWMDNHVHFKIPRPFLYALSQMSFKSRYTDLVEIGAIRVGIRMLENEQPYVKASVPNSFRLTKQVDSITAVSIAKIAYRVNFVHPEPKQGEEAVLVPSFRIMSAHIIAPYYYEPSYDPSRKSGSNDDGFSGGQTIPHEVSDALGMMIMRGTLNEVSSGSDEVKEAMARLLLEQAGAGAKLPGDNDTVISAVGPSYQEARWRASDVRASYGQRRNRQPSSGLVQPFDGEHEPPGC